jgi:hypothetical protein
MVTYVNTDAGNMQKNVIYLSKNNLKHNINMRLIASRFVTHLLTLLFLCVH